jgi:uncharacterized membrane protein YbhN (UPF0104 family)
MFALVAAAVFAAAIAGLVVLLVGGTVRDRLLRLVLMPLPARLAERVEGMAESFLAGLGVLTRRGDLALVAITSVVAWGFEASMYWTVALAFGDPLAAAMTPAAALLTTAIANLATLVPSGPGYVGTFEAGVLLAANGALGISRGTRAFLRGPAPRPALAAGYHLGRCRVVAARRRRRSAREPGRCGRG